MKNKKLNGSYYTPSVIAEFLVNYLNSKLNDVQVISILEPSAGDGIFVKTIFDHQPLSRKIKSFVAVEKNKTELNKIIKGVKHRALKTCHSDFLKFQSNNESKFSLVVGNPPYIKSSLLKNEQLKSCKAIHQDANLSNNKPKNIWTSFLVRCIKFVDDNGVLAFVLPSELLQVKFAAELRELILKEFERVEIFTFNELLFKDCKGQDTLLLIAQRKSNNKGIFYCNIANLQDLAQGKFALAQNAKIRESKWTHHHLETDEIEILENLRQRLKVVNDYCLSKAGIVTAANDFFIIDKHTVEKYSLQSFVKPIVQKGVFVNGSAVLSKEDFETLINNSKPAFLIALDKNSQIRKNAKIWSYLDIGKQRELDKRHKTSLRNIWYQIPNIGTPPEAFFFKRCNEYPKLIKNDANVLSTDSAYTITMLDDFRIDDLVYSFYNSLTLAFAELNGRYYGGGVLELTPNEFKRLPIPFVNITPSRFSSFVSEFKNKVSIKEVCERNDMMILKSIDKNLDNDSIAKLYNIREKLYLRRIKTN